MKTREEKIQFVKNFIEDVYFTEPDAMHQGIALEVFDELICLDKQEKRYFMWDDGDGHHYCVPVELEDKIKEMDALGCGESGYEEYIKKWETMFAKIEPQLIKLEVKFTFTNPKTE